MGKTILVQTSQPGAARPTWKEIEEPEIIDPPPKILPVSDGKIRHGKDEVVQLVSPPGAGKALWKTKKLEE